MTKTFCYAAAMSVLPLTAPAQNVAPPPTATASPTPTVFTSTLGRSVVKNDNGTTTDYSILGTQPFDSKLVGQMIELRIESAEPGKTSTHTLDIHTGKYRSVASMGTFVADIFRRFLAGPVAAGQEIGKIGDVRYGNVIQFTAASPDHLDYSVITPGTQKPLGHFTRADVQAFLTLIR